MELLSACGLAEARLMLRTPSELSDGQRARFRIAFGIAHRGERMFLMNDEFGAVLDRTLAQVVAFNVRKLCTKTGLGFLGATTHDDLIDDLNPNLMVTCRGDGEVAVERRDVKKKRSALPMIFGCRPVPSPIGRTSLGGIIAAITSPSPNE
jgi:ABC-type ATPase with predicted acetyltransferase domain